MLYRVCPTAPERLDAILLAVHPVDEHLCRAQPVEYLVDDHSADADLLSFEQAIFLQDRFIVENQRPLSLPLRPGPEIPVRADAASHGLPPLAAGEGAHVRRAGLTAGRGPVRFAASLTGPAGDLALGGADLQVAAVGADAERTVRAGADRHRHRAGACDRRRP